jgi:hypothetical protein
VELVLVGEVVLKVATDREHFWAEWAMVAPRELTEKVMEVEVAECRGDVLTVLTMEEGEVTLVHSGTAGHMGKAERGE